jgi:hypothetical protein
MLYEHMLLRNNFSWIVDIAQLLERINADGHRRPQARCSSGVVRVGSGEYESARVGYSFVIVSPRRIVPGVTTLALMPRRRNSLPTPTFTKRNAFAPKRAANLGHPVCG